MGWFPAAIVGCLGLARITVATVVSAAGHEASVPVAGHSGSSCTRTSSARLVLDCKLPITCVSGYLQNSHFKSSSSSFLLTQTARQWSARQPGLRAGPNYRGRARARRKDPGNRCFRSTTAPKLGERPSSSGLRFIDFVRVSARLAEHQTFPRAK